MLVVPMLWLHPVSLRAVTDKDINRMIFNRLLEEIFIHCFGNE